MKPNLLSAFSDRLMDATRAVFGDRPLTHAVEEACRRYERDIQNIQNGRGINALTLAIVGAKGQGKTWVARQLVRDTRVKAAMPSGDLEADATKRLVWVGPMAPEGIHAEDEIYIPCQSSDMVELGQPYVILDTPGITDTHHRAAEIAAAALSLAPIKFMVIARDQLRAAANLKIAAGIDGSLCIPVISSVEPDEMQGETMAAQELANDLRALKDQLAMRAPATQFVQEILVPDFEISGDEERSSRSLISQLSDRLATLDLGYLGLSSNRDNRIKSAQARLRAEVSKLIGEELPHLQAAVQRLNVETEQLPERVLESLLGSPAVLETGVRMRLRARLVSDTALLWFPYRTVMSTLNLTHGAWDRVVLALAGSVPSLFGALASWARNARQSKEFSLEIQEGIRQRTQRQVEERLKPLCDQFHRAVTKLRPRDDRAKLQEPPSQGMRLSGIDELQNRSQRIFDDTIARHAASWPVVQTWAAGGSLLFWLFMAGPIVLIYREYFHASISALTGSEISLEKFPHPSSSLLITSVVLSLLPLTVFCMIVLTLMLSRRKVQQVSGQIIQEHERIIAELKQANVIRLEFEDDLLQQAELLLNLRRSEVA